MTPVAGTLVAGEILVSESDALASQIGHGPAIRLAHMDREERRVFVGELGASAQAQLHALYPQMDGILVDNEDIWSHQAIERGDAGERAAPELDLPVGVRWVDGPSVVEVAQVLAPLARVELTHPLLGEASGWNWSWMVQTWRELSRWGELAILAAAEIHGRETAALIEAGAGAWEISRSAGREAWEAQNPGVAAPASSMGRVDTALISFRPERLGGQVMQAAQLADELCPARGIELTRWWMGQGRAVVMAALR